MLTGKNAPPAGPPELKLPVVTLITGAPVTVSDCVTVRFPLPVVVLLKTTVRDGVYGPPTAAVFALAFTLITTVVCAPAASVPLLGESVWYEKEFVVLQFSEVLPVFVSV